ncbi:MAG: DNA polymerase [Pyramidobacter sp.]|jgi:DNA polymerase-1
MSSKKILLIDGHGIAFRAFYAIPHLNAADGTPTNALVGFFNMLGKALQELQPDEVYTAFDMKGPTFRHLLYPDYKGTRAPTPEEFKQQIPLLHQMLPLLGIRIMERQTVEADDLIGSAAVQFSRNGDDVIVLTSDKDIMQILRPGVKIIRPGKGLSSFDVYTSESFTEKYGFPPEKMVDYLSLMGDAVDNIHGVTGVGDKTATRLIRQYGSIEEIMAHAEELTPSLRKNITAQGAQAIENRKLTRLKCDEDLSEFTSAESAADLHEFKKFCSRLGLKKTLENFRISASASAEKGDAAPAEEKAEPPIELNGPIPLDTILEAPRLSLDLDENEGAKAYVITPEILKSRSVILAAPDGSWWKGTLEDLRPHRERFMENSVVCIDAKALCSLMEHPAIGRLTDIKTAWYLLHPDLEKYDAAKELAMGFSPQRAVRLFDLSTELRKQIADQKIDSVMNDIDLPLIPILVNMERRGIRVDREKMTALSDELNGRLEEISQKIRDAAGSDINVNSPKQIGELLFEKLGLPPIKKTKTGYSTNVSVLEQLREICGTRCEVPAWLLEYRELQKMASGFVQPLLTASAKDGLIHSTFEALTTGTGRLSSRDPNMQNLPAYGGWGTRVRECLLPAKEGNAFVAADYSQIELRVLAHLSGDPQLISIFNSDRDIHTETAALIFGLPPEAVTKELRRSAKTVSFGLIYGMSVFGLASRLGTDRASAARIMDAYFSAMPGVREFLESSRKKSLSDGYTATLFGRRRPLDEITTGSTKVHQSRVAVNSPIQGTAADITKIAMRKVTEHFTGKDVHMVLQVHDSLVCECPAESAEEQAAELGEIMEQAVQLSVPLKTERSVGKTLATI